MAAHLEVLLGTTGRVGVAERGHEARAVDRELVDAAVGRRRLDAGQLEDGRGDVDGVLELRAHGAGVAMPLGQCTTSGSRTPPPNVLPLYRLSGVLETCAQPRG